MVMVIMMTMVMMMTVMMMTMTIMMVMMKAMVCCLLVRAFVLEEDRNCTPVVRPPARVRTFRPKLYPPIRAKIAHSHSGHLAVSGKLRHAPSGQNCTRRLAPKSQTRFQATWVCGGKMRAHSSQIRVEMTYFVSVCSRSVSVVAIFCRMLRGFRLRGGVGIAV